jgi:membrane-bound ClpP family serine protease
MGTVLAKGELWTAVTEGEKVERGEEVIITKVEGLKLWVIKKLKKGKG